jgi:superfamily II DNA or RNA helicase
MLNPEVDEPQFIHNFGYQNFYSELQDSLLSCNSFQMSVAFIRYSGIQLLLETFEELERRQIPGKILTSTYLNSTQPKALQALKRFSNIETKIYIPTKDRGFHSKGYIFNYNDKYKIVIGSSNITQCALKSNIEWNVRNYTAEQDAFTCDVQREFNSQWNDVKSKPLSDDFLDEYSKYLARLKDRIIPENAFEYESDKIEPNQMQTEAIVKLDRLRKNQETRALAIAATGSGKTYMAVFDVLQVKPKRLLFIAHREDILIKAKESFDRIIDTRYNTTGFFTGNKKEKADYVFSTIQTLQLHYELFEKTFFDYVIIDEAHHASSPSYGKVLSYFTPHFLLGLTATPERSDNGDIYSIFGNNIAVEIRLRQALQYELVAPFHYFGITEFNEISYDNVDIEDIAAIAKLLMIPRRVEYIIEKMDFYGHDGDKRKALGFCATVEHAQFMAKEFNNRGISSLWLSGESSITERTTAMKRLESDLDELQVIFTVDIFNEGIDVPSINTILMLRPTDSTIIFTQQLGRGLRRIPNKEFVTVLDFIGNHRKSFLMAIALMGTKQFDKDSLKVAVKNSFADIPGSSHIQMDEIARETILAQLENEKFFSLKYLKEEYRNFKHQIGDRIPMLVDYLKIDGAVDPLTFVYFSATYLQFVQKVEVNDEFSELLANTDFINILRFYSNMLPCKRPYEFVISRYLLSHDSITLEETLPELKKYLVQPNINTVLHSFGYLSQKFFDSGELKTFNGLLFVRQGNGLKPTARTRAIFENSRMRKWVEDILRYGLLRYEQEFSDTDYGIPFFRLYQHYTMRETALLANYEKAHSAFRGSGLITSGKECYLFVNLHKNADIKESINYHDKFITSKVFQWESPNTTAQNSERGQDLVYNYKRGINLHLFVRKFEKVEGLAQPFTYLGKCICQQAEGNKPIKMLLALENEVPADLYFELVTKVEG